MGLCAKDMVVSEVICAREDMTVQQLVKILQENGIMGVPVLDEMGHLSGVVSLTDIIFNDEIFGEGPALESDYYKQMDNRGDPLGDDLTLEDVGHLLVRDIMAPDVITARQDTPIEELAGIMYAHKIHRVVIVEEGRLFGIVGTMDVLKAVMEGKVL